MPTTMINTDAADELANWRSKHESEAAPFEPAAEDRESAAAAAESTSLAPRPAQVPQFVALHYGSPESLVPTTGNHVSPEMALPPRSTGIALNDDDNESGQSVTTPKKGKKSQMKRRMKSKLLSPQTPNSWFPPSGPINTRLGWHGPAEGARHVRVDGVKLRKATRSPALMITRSQHSPTNRSFQDPFGHLAHEAWAPTESPSRSASNSERKARTS